MNIDFSKINEHMQSIVDMVPYDPVNDTNRLLEDQNEKLDVHLSNQEKEILKLNTITSSQNEQINKLDTITFQLNKQITIAMNTASEATKDAERSRKLSVISVSISVVAIVVAIILRFV